MLYKFKNYKIFENSSFKNNDDDIRSYFTEYTDEDEDALTIVNGLVCNNKFIEETLYMKDVSKYKRAKLITLKIRYKKGISIGMDSCMTNLELLSNILSDIKRFYDFTDEEINYTINANFNGLEVKFITTGEDIKEGESKYEKIDEYLSKIGELVFKLNLIGFNKRYTFKDNWLEFKHKSSVKWESAYRLFDKLKNIGDGSLNINNCADDIYLQIINIRNSAWEDGLKFSPIGGDQQVILKLIKR